MTALDLREVMQLFGFVALMVTGQVLLKQSAVVSGSIEDISGVLALARNPWFWLAISLYGFATVLWIVILQGVPLSIAYPFVAMTFAIVPAIAALLFGEPLSGRYALGAAMILGGVWLTTSS